MTKGQKLMIMGSPSSGSNIYYESYNLFKVKKALHEEIKEKLDALEKFNEGEPK